LAVITIGPLASGVPRNRLTHLLQEEVNDSCYRFQGSSAQRGLEPEFDCFALKFNPLHDTINAHFILPPDLR